ncbi:hypothetical protein C8R43DRAFT_955221 [Mycena crocata]|nr:hypothetical protein C8R43DRAFT_955221 [Mycena crocata]
MNTKPLFEGLERPFVFLVKRLQQRLLANVRTETLTLTDPEGNSDFDLEDKPYSPEYLPKGTKEFFVHFFVLLHKLQNKGNGIEFKYSGQPTNGCIPEARFIQFKTSIRGKNSKIHQGNFKFLPLCSMAELWWAYSNLWHMQSFDKLSSFRSLQLKPNEPATFIPLRTLKFSNATLTSNFEDAIGKTVVFLTQHPAASGTSETQRTSFEAVPIFCLTASKNEHMSLDIVLAKDTKHTVLAKGPNAVHLLGYFLGTLIYPFLLPQSHMHLSADVSTLSPGNETTAVITALTPTHHSDLPSASSISSASSASSSKSLKRQRSDSLQISGVKKKSKSESQRSGYMYKDEATTPANKSGKVVAHGDTVVVDFKATWSPQGSSVPQVLYREENKTLTLDGSSEQGWKESIAGMKVHGMRSIKVPAHLASGKVETKINQKFIVGED